MGAFFPLDSHPIIYFIIWEIHGFPHQFLIVRENATKPFVWGEPGKLVLTLFPSMGAFFPYDLHPTVHFIIWEMHGFPNQFPIVQENTTKLIVLGEPGKLVLILFSYYGRFFPLDSHFIAYFITWEMHVFSHSFPIT